MQLNGQSEAENEAYNSDVSSNLNSSLSQKNLNTATSKPELKKSVILAFMYG